MNSSHGQSLTVLRLESVAVTVRVYCACCSLFRGTGPVEMSPDIWSTVNWPSLSPAQYRGTHLTAPSDDDDVMITICDGILQGVHGVIISSSHSDY